MRRGHEEKNEQAIVAGIHPVIELLERTPEQVDSVLIRKGRAGREAEQIFALCRAASVRFTQVDKPALDRLFPGNHQGVVARVFSQGFVEYEDALATITQAPLPLLVALDQVQDPGNVGALARSLYGLGGAGLVVPRHGSAALGPAAVRASAGTLTRLPVARVTNLAQSLELALDAGISVYGAGGAAEGPQTPPVLNAFTVTPDFPAILVLGNEEKGIRPNVLKRCSACLNIPLARDLDSLNVAQAGGILTALFARARNA